MKTRAWLTTSWDDGHPLDLRIAEMLVRHGLTGTFYVPRTAQTTTMSDAQLRQLAGECEIGAHTLDHLSLHELDAAAAREQIAGSKAWVENVTGRQCVMFCPPKGHFGGEHLAIVREAGFAGMRTAELYSLDFPRKRSGLAIMPTTLQAYSHSAMGCLKNFARRGAMRNLSLYLRLGRSRAWPAVAQRLLARVMEHGGVFHLWGHSWEIDRMGQWGELEQTLAAMGSAKSHAACVSNGELCRQAADVPAAV